MPGAGHRSEMLSRLSVGFSVLVSESWSRVRVPSSSKHFIGIKTHTHTLIPRKQFCLNFKLWEGYFPFHSSENSQQPAQSRHREAGMKSRGFRVHAFIGIVFSAPGSRNGTPVGHCGHSLSNSPQHRHREDRADMQGAVPLGRPGSGLNWTVSSSWLSLSTHITSSKRTFPCPASHHCAGSKSPSLFVF